MRLLDITRFRVSHITIYFSVHEICLGSLYKLKHTGFRADFDRTEVSSYEDDFLNKVYPDSCFLSQTCRAWDSTEGLVSPDTGFLFIDIQQHSLGGEARQHRKHADIYVTPTGIRMHKSQGTSWRRQVELLWPAFAPCTMYNFSCGTNNRRDVILARILFFSRIHSLRVQNAQEN